MSSKISQLASISGGALADDDTIDVVDKSDSSMASSGTNKRTTIADLVTAITSLGALATDAEVAAAIGALSTVYQPLDADLTAIAALTTTAYGRALLGAANLAALQAILGTGTPSSTTALFGDGSWKAPAAGSSPWQVAIDPGGTPFASSGTWTVDLQTVYYALRCTSAGANGNSITFATSIPAGTWTLNTFYMPSTASGIVDIAASPDNVTYTNIATGLDMYAASPAASRASTTGIVLAAEQRYVKITVNSKNASSSQYYAALSRLLFSRTA